MLFFRPTVTLAMLYHVGDFPLVAVKRAMLAPELFDLLLASVSLILVSLGNISPGPANG
jgi:hypothetical protein